VIRDASNRSGTKKSHLVKVCARNDSDRLTRAQALDDKASKLCQAKAGSVEVVAGEVAHLARLAHLAHLARLVREASRQVCDNISFLQHFDLGPPDATHVQPVPTAATLPATGLSAAVLKSRVRDR
jgi:hypothetical protein